MDSKTIEQLLERYWRCETSLEEEARLRAYFTSGEVAPALLRYQALFAYQKQQQTESLDAEFDARLSRRMEHPVKARRLTLTMRFVPLMRAAGVVLFFLTLGHWMQHSIFQADESVPCAEAIDEQITAPSVALSDKVQAPESIPADTLPAILLPPEE